MLCWCFAGGIRTVNSGAAAVSAHGTQWRRCVVTVQSAAAMLIDQLSHDALFCPTLPCRALLGSDMI